MNGDEMQLLKEFALNGSEEAFTELVRRHVDLVWSAAWRVTRDADLSRDVAQTVFADLARKARCLPPETIIAGWLYRAACLAASKSVRNNVRRAQREQEAMHMHSINAPDPDSERAIQELVSLLDEALGQLGETDRNAVVLRFFAGKSLAELGAALGVSDDAAQKRLSRAMERLRQQFRRRSMAVSSGLLGAVLTAAGSQSAPTGLAAALAMSSLAAVSAASSALPILTSIPTQLAAMKTQLAWPALIAIAVSTPLVIQQHTLGRLRSENQTLTAQMASLDDLRGRRALLLEAEAATSELDYMRRLQNEAAQLEAEARRLREADIASRVELRSQMREAEEILSLAQKETARVEEEMEFRERAVAIVNALKELGIAARLYANDHAGVIPQNFELMEHEMRPGLSEEMDFSQFEFVQHDQPVTDTSSPNLLYLCEKEPRQTPSGNWEAAYSLIDGSVHRRWFASPDQFLEWKQTYRIQEPSN